MDYICRKVLVSGGMGLLGKVTNAQKVSPDVSVPVDTYWDSNPKYQGKTKSWKQKEMNSSVWGQVYHLQKKMIENVIVPLYDEELKRVLPVKYICWAQTDAAGHLELNGFQRSDHPDKYFTLDTVYQAYFRDLLKNPLEWKNSFPWKTVSAREEQDMLDVFNCLHYDDVKDCIARNDTVRILVEGGPSLWHLVDGIHHPIFHTHFLRTETPMSKSWLRDVVINQLIPSRYNAAAIERTSMNEIILGWCIFYSVVSEQIIVLVKRIVVIYERVVVIYEQIHLVDERVVII